MSHRVFTTLFIPAVVLASCVTVLVVGQQPISAQEGWSPPQTPWGHPDLQGTWSNASTTPLERPADLTGQEVLSDEEWAGSLQPSPRKTLRPMLLPGAATRDDADSLG